MYYDDGEKMIEMETPQISSDIISIRAAEFVNKFIRVNCLVKTGLESCSQINLAVLKLSPNFKPCTSLNYVLIFL